MLTISINNFDDNTIETFNRFYDAMNVYFNYFLTQ